MKKYCTLIMLLPTFILAQWSMVNETEIGVSTKLASYNNIIFAYGRHNGEHILRSSDNGVSWESIADQFPEDLYHISGKGKDLLAVLSAGGGDIWPIYKSDDEGKSWYSYSQIEFPNGAILQIKQFDNFILANTNHNSYFESIDNGLTWTQITIADPTEPNILDITGQGSIRAIVLIGLGAKISFDNGVTWLSDDISPNITAVRNVNGNIYGFTYNGLYQLTNEATWKAKSNGLPNSGALIAVKSLTHIENQMYMATSSLLGGLSSVYTSNDNAESWTEISSEGLGATNGCASGYFLEATENSLYLYYYGLLDKANSGLYKSDISITDITTFNNSLPENFQLMQNYPNPFNPSTKITFSIASLSAQTVGGVLREQMNAIPTTLVVYDILGNKVKTLVNAELNPGSYSVDFNASQISSGTYIYQLTSGTNTLSKKMILLK